MERCKGESSNSSTSSTTSRKFYYYGEWIAFELGECGHEMVLRTAWTNDNPGRRYWECRSCKGGFVKWYDPPMCDRAKKIIPGLLKKINQKDEEIAKLKTQLSARPRSEECEVKVMGKSRKWTALMLAMVVAVLVISWCCENNVPAFIEQCKLPAVMQSPSN